VPWDKGTVTAVRHGTLRLASGHMRVCLAAADAHAAVAAAHAEAEAGSVKSFPCA
jgi:hypothetical protein